MSRIFICYRRADSLDVVGRLYDYLVNEFSADAVFRDLDSIPLSVPFPQYVKQALANADAVLVIIGPNWLAVENADGNRRIDDPDDFVRVEIETALRLQRPIIPVTVSHAGLPTTHELPDSLGKLPFSNGVPLRPDPDFHNDVARLVKALRKLHGVGRRSDTKRRQKSPQNRFSMGAVLGGSVNTLLAIVPLLLLFVIAFAVVGAIIVVQQVEREPSLKVLADGILQMWNNAWCTAIWPYLVMIPILVCAAQHGGYTAARIAGCREMVHAFITGMFVSAAIVGLNYAFSSSWPEIIEKVNAPAWMIPAWCGAVLFGVIVGAASVLMRRAQP